MSPSRKLLVTLLVILAVIVAASSIAHYIYVFDADNDDETPPISPPVKTHVMTGTVRDSWSLMPIANVSIFRDGVLHSQSGEDGFFVFPLSEGSHMLEFVAQGYLNESFQIDVWSDITRNVYLDRV